MSKALCPKVLLPFRVCFDIQSVITVKMHPNYCQSSENKGRDVTAGHISNLFRVLKHVLMVISDNECLDYANHPLSSLVNIAKLKCGAPLLVSCGQGKLTAKIRE